MDYVDHTNTNVLPETKGKPYRKKPIVVEAFQWQNHRLTPHSQVMTTDNAFHESMGNPSIDISNKDNGYIRTLEGWMKVMPGDWVIRGVVGEVYPCKDHVFAQTYEKVEGPTEDLTWKLQAEAKAILEKAKAAKNSVRANKKAKK